MAPPSTGKILYRPVLVVTWPDTIEVMVNPTIIGVSIRPLSVGEAPWTVCWYSGRNVIAPNMARPVRKVRAMVTEKFRFLNTCSGRIGSAARVWRYRNPAVAAAVSRARPMICPEPQRYSVPPQVASRISEVAATASRHAAEVVDLVADPVRRHVQGGHQVDQGRAADRDVDVEDPAPGEVGGDEPAQQRAADGGQHHHDHHVAHVTATFPRGHDVAHAWPSRRPSGRRRPGPGGPGRRSARPWTATGRTAPTRPGRSGWRR